jgi:hypothetical protein
VFVYLHAGRSHSARSNAHHRLSLYFVYSLKEPSTREPSIFSESLKVNMGGELPKEAIILIVICSAGASVVIAWAIHSIWHGQRGSPEEIVVSNGELEQAAYRQEVRMRNYHNMAAINGFKYPSNRYDEI